MSLGKVEKCSHIILAANVDHCHKTLANKAQRATLCIEFFNILKTYTFIHIKPCWTFFCINLQPCRQVGIEFQNTTVVRAHQ